jgi:hypothetical protein
MTEEQEQYAPTQQTASTQTNPVNAFRPTENQQSTSDSRNSEPESTQDSRNSTTENTQESQVSALNGQSSESAPVVVSATAQLFEAEGISTADAIERGEILDRLLSGEKVSNSQLEKMAHANDAAGQRAFAAATGVTVPSNLTLSQLRKFYRTTAEQIVEERKSKALNEASTQQALQTEQENADALVAEQVLSNAFKPNAAQNASESVTEDEVSDYYKQSHPEIYDRTLPVTENGKTRQMSFDEFAEQMRATEGERVTRDEIEQAWLDELASVEVDKEDNAEYNKNRRDPKVQEIIDRLNEGEVPLDEIMSLPAIVEVEKNNAEATQTIDLPNREEIVEGAYEKAMQRGSFDGKDYTAPVRQERRMDIVLGLPGSGKSSVYTERISQEQGARVIDTDDYREYIPEYNGQNAPVVHEEASTVKKRVMKEALVKGDNILLSTIGNNAEKLEREIMTYNEAGYSVYIHLNELPNHKSQGRAMGRFFKSDGTTGRYVSPALIAAYGDTPTQTYLYLLGRSDINGVRTEENNTADSTGESGVSGNVAENVREGRGRESGSRTGSTSDTVSPKGARIAGYDWYNNDVNFGEPPILVESSEPKEGNNGTQSGIQTADNGENTDGNGGVGARLDGMSGGREVGEDIPGERNDGRGDTQLSKVVRLSVQNNKSISDSGSSTVELQDFTDDPAAFSSALDAARNADTENGWAVSPQDADNLKQRGVRLLMRADGATGLGVTPEGDIIGAFKNPNSGVKGALRTLLPTAIDNGGTKLDCYGFRLVQQYQKYGFIPVARVKFVAEYANEGWSPEKGEPDIYFMMHNGDSAEVSLQKSIDGTYEVYTQEYLDSLPEMEYDEAEHYRDGLLQQQQTRMSFEGKTVAFDDGTELTYEEFAKKLHEVAPDMPEDAIEAAFAAELENDVPIPTEEKTEEGQTEATIAPEVVEEITEGSKLKEHVHVDEGVHLTRGQQWLANFIGITLRKSGVVTDVEISNKYGNKAEGAMTNGVLTLSPRMLNTKTAESRALLNRTIGHEMFHGTIDSTKTENGKRSTKLVDEVLETMQSVDPMFDLEERLKAKRELYTNEFRKQTNPNTGALYTETEIKLKVSDTEMREEIAAEEMGYVFDAQDTLLDMADMRPDFMVRAYMAAHKLSLRARNRTPEAKAARKYLIDQQKRFRAALKLAGDYQVSNGSTETRESIADKPWSRQIEMALIANGLRNMEGWSDEDYAEVRSELGNSVLSFKGIGSVLQEIGFEHDTFSYTQLHFIDAVLPIINENGKRVNEHWHGIDEETLNAIPELLRKPVMVIKSRKIDEKTGELSTHPMAVLDAYDSEGVPLVAILKRDGKLDRGRTSPDTNHIDSVFGAREMWENVNNLLKWESENNGFLYVNGARTEKMLRKVGYKNNEKPDANLTPMQRAMAQAQEEFKPWNEKLAKDRLNKSKYKLLASHPYLREVQLDTVLQTLDEAEGKTTARARTGVELPESLMRSGYNSDGELLRWRKNSDGTYTADETTNDAVYLNMSSPLVLDCNGRTLEQVGEVSYGRGDTVKAIRDEVYSNELMYDGIVLRNVCDAEGNINDVAIQLTDAQVIPAQATDTRMSFEDRQYAPVFYSKLERVIESQKQEKFGASSVINMLKGKAIKAEEIKWSGVTQFLEGKKSVTKVELLQFVRDNQLQIETVRMGGEPVFDPDAPRQIMYAAKDGTGSVLDYLPRSWREFDVLDPRTGEVYGSYEWNDDEAMFGNIDTGAYVEDSESAIVNEIQSRYPDDGFIVGETTPDTRWEQYSLNGGQNYRELLYTLPDSDYSNHSMGVHWGRAGVLVHARVQDFVNAEGKSVLFIDEIQSDWHNAGQKSGYADPAETETKNRELLAKVSALNAELDTGELNDIAKKLAFLRYDNTLEYAKNFIASMAGRPNDFITRVLEADKNSLAQVYDSDMALLNGDEERLSLTRKGLQQIQADAKVIQDWQQRWLDANQEYRNFKWSLPYLAPDAPFRNNTYTDFALKNLIRDAAEGGYDMIAWTTAAQQSARWSDDYAEGYRIEYDQDIPSFLKKYGKQWGAKVGYTLIGNDLTDTGAYQDGGMEAVMNIAWNNANEEARLSDGSYIVHSMDITDAMRESVLYEGQPRFSFSESPKNYTENGTTNELFSSSNALRFSITPGLTADEFVRRAAERWKASRVRTNTYRNSGLFTRTELQMQGLREEDLGYHPVSEIESMHRAEERLEKDYAGTRQELLNPDTAWTGSDLDAAMGILSNEITNARESGNYSEVIRWAKQIREHGTTAGQMIQAFSKYTRTPEGVLVRAEETLSQSSLNPAEQEELLRRIASMSETLNAIQTGNKEDLIQLILKQAEIRQTPVSKRTLSYLRADSTDFQFLYNTAITQLDQMAKDYVQTSFGRKVATWQTMAHLLNIRTSNRNSFSNLIFDTVDTAASNLAQIPDMLLSLVTGKRTVGADMGVLSKASRQGMAERGKKAAIEVALDVAPDDARDKYGTSRRTFKMTGAKYNPTGAVSKARRTASRGMSTLEKAMGYELNVTDEMAKGSITARIRSGLQKYVDNGTLTAEEADQMAKEEALYRTFQDDTKLSEGLGKLKSFLNWAVGFGHTQGSDSHDFGLGDFIIKYTQVPGAMVTRVLEYAPTGYAKMLYHCYKMFQANRALSTRTDLSDKARAELEASMTSNQRKASLFLGRAATGTGLIAAFVALAAKGILLRGDDEDDADAKALRTAMGVSGTQLNFSALERLIEGDEDTSLQDGDVLASTDFLEPVLSLMVIGELIANSDEGRSIGNTAVSTFAALSASFSELSVMSSIGNLVQSYQYYTPESGVGLENEDMDRWATMAVNLATSNLSGFVPSVVRQVAQGIDDKNRDTYSERDIWSRTAAQIKNSIPGLRETLPEKQTNLGEGKPTEDTLLRMLNATFIPGKVSTYRANAAADELASVYSATDNANVYPDRNAPYKITIGSGADKETYELSAEERAAYQTRRGQLSEQLIEQAVSSDAYRAADADTKADILTTTKNYANYVAKQEALEGQGKEYSDSTYDNYKEMLDSGMTLADYLLYSDKANNIEADKDENGDSISGTAKLKTINLISDQSMGSDQKAALYFKAYSNEKELYDSLDCDFDEYLTYSQTMCTTTADKDENGKTISGSKREKVVALIDSLNISKEAKHKLYEHNGYAASKEPSWS